MSREEHDIEVENALARVPGPASCPKFREELRRRFLECPEARARPRRIGVAIGLLVAASVIFAIGYLLYLPRGIEWRVLEVAPNSIVKADGVSLPVEDRDLLASGLQRAGEIVVERGGLLIQVGDIALFDVAEGTRASFAFFETESTTLPYVVHASSGRLRARTGPGFSGRGMEVHADLMDVTVTGTAFAVDYEGEGTCICCLHGSVAVVSKATGPDPKPVEPKSMCLVFRDDRPPLWGGPPDSHAQPLMSLEARALEIWR